MVGWYLISVEMIFMEFLLMQVRLLIERFHYLFVIMPHPFPELPF